MTQMRITILGCGSSGGVPRIGNRWGECDPLNPKNRRRRCSILVERITDAGTTRVIIDTSPDMREQMLDADVETVDAVVFTHAHADHVHGLDDIRQVAYIMGGRIPVWADAFTQTDLMARFGYVFETPKGSDYPPICDLNTIDGAFTVDGDGGAIEFIPLAVQHGRIPALGFRIGGVAYIPDVSEIADATWTQLEGLDLWIIDALRRTPHSSHSHLSQTVEWIERAEPKAAVITNMHIDLDYADVENETPEGVVPAFDGMTLTLDI